MRYVFLVYRDEKLWDAMSPSERDTLKSACLADEHELWQSGHLIAVNGLDSSRIAITVQVVNGKVSFTDGPFTDTSGQLIQLFFINARDLNEAIQIASKMPQARSGSIEVRPILESPTPHAVPFGS